MSESVIRFPVYRCEKCKGLITRDEIRAAWARGSSPSDLAVCRCGSRRFSPTNLTLWQELTSVKVWRQFFSDRRIYDKSGQPL